MTAQWLKEYYAQGKRGTLDGVPMLRPKWWGKLGNDKEFREATRERYNAAHYPEGTIRIVRDGIPYRFAAHVAKWKPGNKAALCQGSDPFGLTLVPRDKRGRLVYDASNGLRKRYGHRTWQLSHNRRNAEYDLNKFQFPPDLFVWGRWERKRLAARQKAGTL